MKKNALWWVLGLALVSTAGTPGSTQANGLDNRIHKLAARFEAMQQKPDKRVPADPLQRARGIILLDCARGGIGFAFEGGYGAAMLKDARGNWSPPAFLTASEASLGPQFGGEQNFYVILLMTTNETRQLAGSVVDFGGVAQGTAGDQSSSAQKLAVPKDSGLLYSDREGFFGGAAFQGGTVSPDNRANTIYYGRAVTMNDILSSDKVKSTPAATRLTQTILKYSRPPEK